MFTVAPPPMKPAGFAPQASGSRATSELEFDLPSSKAATALEATPIRVIPTIPARKEWWSRPRITSTLPKSPTHGPAPALGGQFTVRVVPNGSFAGTQPALVG